MSEPVTLCSSAAKGDEWLSLTGPVPDRSWITLSAGTDYWERVPAYACVGTGPYLVQLGIPSADQPDGILHVKLGLAHCVGSAIEVRGAQEECEMSERWARGGHLSGDTPVTEMSFPEAFMRPAMGTPVPEPQDAAPHVPTLACPKCGEPNTTMNWCEGGYSLAWGQCVSDPDHFHRGCPRCQYRWVTHDVLDGQ